MHHDLDAIATPALVGVADELDVAECHRIHGSPPIAPPLVLSRRRPLSYRGDAEKVARIKQPFPHTFDQQHIGVKGEWFVRFGATVKVQSRTVPSSCPMAQIVFTGAIEL
jgi:hypothetical protein